VVVSDAHLRSGDFAELAMPLFDPLYNFACWLTHDRAEAEDLVQETFAKALKGFTSFQLGTNFRAWMFRIMHNTFLNSRTGLKAAMVPLENEENAPPALASNETPESLLLRRSDWQLVQDALEDLPLRYREVLLLCDVEELAYKEIASVLGIPIGTVMSRVSRARQALRDAIMRRKKGVANAV